VAKLGAKTVRRENAVHGSNERLDDQDEDNRIAPSKTDGEDLLTDLEEQLIAIVKKNAIMVVDFAIDTERAGNICGPQKLRQRAVRP